MPQLIVLTLIAVFIVTMGVKLLSLIIRKNEVITNQVKVVKKDSITYLIPKHLKVLMNILSVTPTILMVGFLSVFLYKNEFSKEASIDSLKILLTFSPIILFGLFNLFFIKKVHKKEYDSGETVVFLVCSLNGESIKVYCSNEDFAAINEGDVLPKVKKASGYLIHDFYSI